MTQTTVFGKAAVQITGIKVIDPDGTVTEFNQQQVSQDMGTPESRKAAADAKRETEKR